MSNELTYHSAADSGSTIDAYVENAVGDQWTGSAYEAPTDANVGNRAISIDEEENTGDFRGDMPTGSASAGMCCFIVRKRAGGAPAITDAVRGTSPLFGWDGSAVVSLSAIIADTNELQSDWADGGRLDLLIDAIKAKTDLRPSGIPKNVALSNFPFLMIDSSDHLSPKTGLTVTAKISKDGGAFAASTNSSAEISHGVYDIDLTQAERNADVSTIKLTAEGADQRTITIVSST